MRKAGRPELVDGIGQGMQPLGQQLEDDKCGSQAEGDGGDHQMGGQVDQMVDLEHGLGGQQGDCGHQEEHHHQDRGDASVEGAQHHLPASRNL